MLGLGLGSRTWGLPDLSRRKVEPAWSGASAGAAVGCGRRTRRSVWGHRVGVYIACVQDLVHRGGLIFIVVEVEEGFVI